MRNDGDFLGQLTSGGLTEDFEFGGHDTIGNMGKQKFFCYIVFTGSNTFMKIRTQEAPISFNNRAGFTLVELMIVVSILGILATIAVPKFADLVRKSREGVLKGNLGAMRSALNIYYADMEGNYPTMAVVGTTYNILETLTVNGKYMSSFPFAFVPDYHTTSLPGSPEYDINGPNAASFAGVMAISPVELDTTWQAAFWGYFDDPTYPATYGQMFVWCYHTDTKGTTWSSY